MPTSDAPDPAKTFLRLARVYLDVNSLGPQWQDHLVREIVGMNDGLARSAFLDGLKDAMSGRGVTARDYELATGWAFDTDDEYRTHLKEIWAWFPELE